MQTQEERQKLAQDRGKTLIGILEDAGYEPYSYSGRGMYGKTCVSVHADRDSGISLWVLAQELVDHGLPEPKQDQLGLGMVYYWPSYEWPDGE